MAGSLVPNESPMPLDGEVVRDLLGAALLASRLITPADLARAETEADRSGEPLGQVLLRLELVDETNLVVTNALRLGHLYVELDEYPIDVGAVARLPQSTARRLQALPIDWDGDELVVAMVNPSDVVARDDLKLLTGSSIRPVVVTPTALETAITKMYRLGETEFGDAEPESADEISAQLENSADAAPIVRLLNNLIGQAIVDNASDVHIEPTETDVCVRYRIDGVLHEVNRLQKSIANALLSRLKIMADVDISERRLPQDGRVTATIGGRRADLRISTLPTVFGEQATIRILDRSAPLFSLAQLGFLPEELAIYRRISSRVNGTILTTGPTGSGKSTTLYATLAEINSATRKVITVEDPVEFRLNGITQVQVNNRAGLSFAVALRAILRSDPDIVLVGEIRDRETATIAIEAALTGHLVLSTLHTNDAPSAAIRLIEMGIDAFLVASALDGIIAQRLARKACERCRVLVDPTPAERAVFDGAGVVTPATVVRTVGCVGCSKTGFRGRVAIVEIMHVTEAIEALIAQGARSDLLRRQALEEGMRPLLAVGLHHAASGVTTVEEVLRVVA